MIQYFSLFKITIVFEEAVQVYSVISPMVECYADCGRAFDEFLADYYIKSREIIASFIKEVMRTCKDVMRNQWVMIWFNFHEDNCCYLSMESSLSSLLLDGVIDENKKASLMGICMEFRQRIEEIGTMIEERLCYLTNMK